WWRHRSWRRLVALEHGPTIGARWSRVARAGILAVSGQVGAWRAPKQKRTRHRAGPGACLAGAPKQKKNPPQGGFFGSVVVSSSGLLFFSSSFFSAFSGFFSAFGSFFSAFGGLFSAFGGASGSFFSACSSGFSGSSGFFSGGGSGSSFVSGGLCSSRLSGLGRF